MNQNQLKTNAEKAAARTEAWMLRHISEETLLNCVIADPVSTAFIGWVACELKNRELADSILPFFEKLAEQKIADNKFWLRMAPVGSLIKTVPENAEHKEYVIQLGNEKECYYFLAR